MQNSTSCGENSGGGEGDDGSPSSAKEPLLSSQGGSHYESDTSRCMRRHLRRQLSGVGRLDLSTGEYPA